MSYHHRFPGSGSGSGSGSSSGFHFLNSPFGDTTYTKVFVGGLAWETKNDTLGRYFEHFGEILEAVVITDKNTGRSKGYGFVTFRDPESAQRACADPSPVIDGRRANCNLASLRRTWPSSLHAQMRPASPFIGPTTPQGAYLGGSTYPQPVPYNYQQGFVYPPYGFMSYGPDYAYQQNAYTPFAGQQFVPIYGIPGIPNPSVYPYAQLGQHLSTGQGYTSQPYATPGHQFMQFTGPNFTGAASAPMPILPPPYPSGMPAQRAASPLLSDVMLTGDTTESTSVVAPPRVGEPRTRSCSAAVSVVPHALPEIHVGWQSMDPWKLEMESSNLQEVCDL